MAPTWAGPGLFVYRMKWTDKEPENGLFKARKNRLSQDFKT